MIGKSIYFQSPYDIRDYGRGEIFDKVLDNNTDKYVVKLESGDVKTIPCSWVKSIK